MSNRKDRRKGNGHSVTLGSIPTIMDEAPATDEDTGVDVSLSTDSTIRNVPVTRLYVEPGFNVREEAAYTPKSLEPLRLNIERFGLEKPLKVSEQPDGRMKLLQGHRRKAAIDLIRAFDLHRVSLGEIDAKAVRFGVVPCIVIKGADVNVEIASMLDHGHVRGLNTLERFNGIEKLRHRLGWNETKIVQFMNLPRGKVTNLFKVACMPPFVRDEYRKYLSKSKDALDLKTENVKDLYSNWTTAVASPDFDVDGGPVFKGSWERVVNQGKAPKISKTDLRELITSEKAIAGHSILIKYLAALLDDAKINPSALSDSRQAIEAALKAAYPPVVKVTEGNVTREIGADA